MKGTSLLTHQGQMSNLRMTILIVHVILDLPIKVPIYSIHT